MASIYKSRRGAFRVKGYGTFWRTRSDYNAVQKKGNTFFDVMGTKHKTRKGASSANAFISAMGL